MYSASFNFILLDSPIHLHCKWKCCKTSTLIRRRFIGEIFAIFNNSFFPAAFFD